MSFDKTTPLDILKNRIKENNLSGVYMFCGPEEFMKDHYVSRMRKKVEASPLPEFNHIFFNAASDKLSDLEDSIYSLPYMWDSKLIEITDIESAKLNTADIDDYARIFSDIPDYLTILCVLRSSADIPKKNTENKKDDNVTDNEESEESPQRGLRAFISTVEEFGLVVDFNPEKADKLTTWIAKHFNANAVLFEANVPREIINYCGSDMYILQGEIAKLAEVFNGKPLTAADVRKYCCSNSDFKYFDMANALNRRDIVSVKKIYDSLNLDREEIRLALGFLVKNYLDMLHVKTAVDSGKSHDIIAKDLKKPSWLVSKMASSVSSVDKRMLTYAITQLSAADAKLKNYYGNPWRILELAFYRICAYGKKA